MSLHTVRKCDECRAPRGETNHWWAALGGAKRPQFLTARAADGVKTGPRGFRLDFCSHKCVTSAFNRWLDTGSVTRRKVMHVETAPTVVDVDRYLDDRVAAEEYARLT